MANRDHLFKPGQSGNPGGRPKKERALWETALLEALKQRHGKKTKLQAVAETLIKVALAGDVPAIKEIGDRVDGKAIARSDPVDVNVTGYGAALIEAARRRAAGEE